MILHPRRPPVVTCHKCGCPFKMTDKIKEEAIVHTYVAHPVAFGSVIQPPVRYKCPHCGKRSLISQLVGEDIEPFDATAEDES